MPDVLHVILNPASGSQQAEAVFHKDVEPELKRVDLVVEYTVHRTERPDHAADLVASIVDTAAEKVVRLLLLGGDGTTHEALNGINRSDRAKSSSLPRIEVSVVPTGTANALHAGLYPPHHGASQHEAARLHSLQAMLASLQSEATATGTAAPAQVPLTFARVTATSAGTQSTELISHLVTSHAFHASILLDSDSSQLRAKYPGVERFKVAAGMNVTRWTNFPVAAEQEASSSNPPPGTLRLLPFAHDGRTAVQSYNGRTRTFEAIEEGSSALELSGPFFYVAALATDRLEPTFVPGPFAAPLSSAKERDAPGADEWQQLRSRLAHPPDALDIVVIRPTRDPAVRAAIAASSALSGQKHIDWASSSEDVGKIKQQFAATRLAPITAAMYDEGKHVQLTYPAAEGSDLETDGAGEYVVEYFRAGGYAWTSGPEGHGEERSRVTCVDGTIIRGDRVHVQVVQDLTEHVRVWR